MPSRWWGFNPPFVGGVQGVLSRQEDVRLIKNDILQLLLTLPGERVHRPDFGTSLRASVFEPLTNPYLLDLAGEIETAIVIWETRVINPSVTIEANVDALTIKVTVISQLSFDPNIQLELETELNAPGVANG